MDLSLVWVLEHSRQKCILMTRIEPDADEPDDRSIDVTTDLWIDVDDRTDAELKCAFGVTPGGGGRTGSRSGEDDKGKTKTNEHTAAGKQLDVTEPRESSSSSSSSPLYPSFPRKHGVKHQSKEQWYRSQPHYNHSHSTNPPPEPPLARWRMRNCVAAGGPGPLGETGAKWATGQNGSLRITQEILVESMPKNYLRWIPTTPCLEKNFEKIRRLVQEIKIKNKKRLRKILKVKQSHCSKFLLSGVSFDRFSFKKQE